MRTSRLEAFSDGVLAIIITVMVLELREPGRATLAGLWQSAGPGLLTYLLSFVYVGIYWTNHHHMFQLTQRVTGGILWANLGLLFCLSLYPFTTSWMDTSHFATTPVVVYGVNLLAAGIAYWVLQQVIIASQGRDSVLRRAVGRDFKGRGSVVGYVIACVAAVTAGDGPGRIGVWVAIAIFIAIAAWWVVPDRRIESVITAHGDTGPDTERERGDSPA